MRRFAAALRLLFGTRPAGPPVGADRERERKLAVAAMLACRSCCG